MFFMHKGILWYAEPMSKLALYCKYELIYLLSIILLIPTPLGIFFEYSQFKAPGLSYTLIGVLFTFQYFFYNQKAREKKLWPKLTQMLEKKLGRVPPQKTVHQYVIEVAGFRIISITIASFLILIISAIYKRLVLF